MRKALIICLALAPPAGLVRAQGTGEIEGAVTGAGGIGLPGAVVIVTGAETGATRTAVAGPGGLYDVKAVPGGTYTVAARVDGFRGVVRHGVEVSAGRVVRIDLRLEAGRASDTITLVAGSPMIETARSGTAAYIGEKEIEALPMLGRDFTDLAVLAPAVLRDDVGGFLTASGQRAIYTGLTIDGADAKSAFFGYGRGGEAAADDGPPVGLDSVEEVQVMVDGFAPELGASGGARVNLVTRAGTNRLEGRAFFYTRDEDLKEDLERSPLDRSLGRTDPIEPGEFARDTHGASIGGPIRRDRTHWFLSFDRTDRSQPFGRSIDARGLYDAILTRARTDPRFLALITGFTPRDDGAAAPDPVDGRTATGSFRRDIDNRVLLGKLDQRIDDANTLTARVHTSDYENRTSFTDEESDKLEDTRSLVLQHAWTIGPDKLNQLRVQLAGDDLQRSSARVGQGIAARIDYGARGADSGNAAATLGKAGFLPILVEESKLEIQESFSVLFGNHDTKFGLDYQEDEVEYLFADRRDGRYAFDTLEDFIANTPSFVDIFFGDVTFPNYADSQVIYGVYAQDGWRPSADLSIHYGVRLGGTLNPDDLEHLFPEGRDIPDDTDNIGPRFGFAWSPDGDSRSVVRGGVGLFFGRTPSLIFAGQVQENGLFPNAGPVRVRPGDIGYVPLGEAIDNASPPPGIAVAAGFVDPGFEDAETLRIHLGYERELMPDWSCGVDLIWADGEKLLENIDINRTFTTDAAGRPIYSPSRPLTRGDVTGEPDDTPLGEVLTRQSVGESEHRAITVSVKKRFSDRYQLQAHYTRAEDKDTSSNEGAATGVTLLRPDDPRYDFGFSDRDVKDRLVVSGLVELPGGFTVSGVYEYRGGRPFNPVDRSADLLYCGFAEPDFDCPDVRPLGPNGTVRARNSFRNESFDRLDLRVGKFFELADRYRADIFFEVFNVFDDQASEVDDSSNGDRQRDPTDSQFGLASRRVLDSREMQIGVRVAF